MASPPVNRASKAGGVFLALGTVAGVIVGGLLGQPSIGFLAGLGAGIALVVLIWLIDRR